MKVLTRFVTLAITCFTLLVTAAIPASAQTAQLEPDDPLAAEDLTATARAALESEYACFVRISPGFSRTVNKYEFGAIYITTSFSRENTPGSILLNRPVETCSGNIVFKGASRLVPEAAVNPEHPDYEVARVDLERRVISSLDINPRTVDIYPHINYHSSSGSLVFVPQPRDGTEEFLCFVRTTVRFSRSVNQYQAGAIYLDANFSREVTPGARSLTRPVGDCQGRLTYKGASNAVPEAAVNPAHPDYGTESVDLQQRVFDVVNSDNRDAQPYSRIGLYRVEGRASFLPTDFADSKWDCYLSEPTIAWSRTGEERFSAGAVYIHAQYSRTETPGSKKMPYPMDACSGRVQYKTGSFRVAKETVDPANPAAAEFTEARHEAILEHQVILYRLAPQIANAPRLITSIGVVGEGRYLNDTELWYVRDYRHNELSLLDGLLVN